MQMNALQRPSPSTANQDEDEPINIAEYFDILLDNIWLIALVAIVVFLVGGTYAVLTNPIYEANLTIQVEDSDKSAGSFLGDAASSLFDVKTPAAGEIEIIKSRMILASAVENTKMYISARPKRIPVIGAWLARRATDLSEPGFLWMPGLVRGTENINVAQFDVPNDFLSTKFTLTLEENGAYSLTSPLVDKTLMGTIGKPLVDTINGQKLNLLVSAVNGQVGAKFEIMRNSAQLTTSALQEDLKVIEKGKQSGVLDVRLQSANAQQLTSILNEIGRLYVRQNIDRKAAEAEKTLGFLDSELPKFKRQLEQSEDVYNKYRNQNGTVSLDDEAKNALSQTIDLQGKLIELQQRRRELLSKFTEKHPAVQTVDAQIAALNSEIAGVDVKIRRLPMLQQDALRMQRDIKVNTDLYVSLLNSSLQMRLAKEGKVGNVRLLDDAVLPEEPVKPKKPIVIGLSIVLGLILGAAIAIVKNLFYAGIRNPNEIEAHTGLSVYSSIPLSADQRQMDQNVEQRVKGIHVLALSSPEDPAIESLRSLRTALQFAMIEAKNNRVLISGPTPGVGKSFVSVNFAAIMAMSGKNVLLIDADLRKGHINQVFSLPRKYGLSELIAGATTLDRVIQRQVLPNLDLITTGNLPPNPAELLMSESFQRVLDVVSEKYDVVIIDTAPVLVASDTAAVAPHAGTLLLVARAEKSHLGELNETIKRLAHSGSHANGVILNAMDLSKRHYGSYGYKYGGYRYTQYKYQAPNT